MVTMGAVFFAIPAVFLLSSIIFTALWLRTGRRRNDESDAQISDAFVLLKDPLMIAVVLSLAGFAMILLLSGDVSISDYFSVPKRAAEVLGDTLTDWTDPLSSEAIAVRGGVLIVVAATIGAVVALISYFGRCLAESGRRDRSGASSNLESTT